MYTHSQPMSGRFHATCSSTAHQHIRSREMESGLGSDLCSQFVRGVVVIKHCTIAVDKIFGPMRGKKTGQSVS